MPGRLPVPITAVHTTTLAYCFGDGLLSRHNGSGTPSIQTDAIIGRLFRQVGIGYFEIDIPAGVTGLTGGLFIYINDVTQGHQFIDFLNTSGQEMFNFNVTSSRAIQARRGTTVLGTATTNMGASSGAINFFEFDIEFDDAGGIIKFRANVGDLEIDLSSQDTINNAGTLGKMRFGLSSDFNTPQGYFGVGYLKDRGGATNFYGRGVHRFFPYTADVGVEFTPTGAGSNNNDRIKETDPDGDTTRVSSSTDGHKDTYGPPDASAVTGAVKCMWNYQGCKQDGSALLHSVLDTPGAAEDVEAEGRLVPFGAYGGIATAYEEDPDTSLPWTGAAISALEALGFELEVP
jgi:hypothetical protein